MPYNKLEILHITDKGEKIGIILDDNSITFKQGAQELTFKDKNADVILKRLNVILNTAKVED